MDTAGVALAGQGLGAPSAPEIFSWDCMAVVPKIFYSLVYISLEMELAECGHEILYFNEFKNLALRLNTQS